MRLRVRLLSTGQTAKLDVSEHSSLQQLQTSLSANVLPELRGVAHSTITLSLNKKDPLDALPTASLRSLGLSSGDLLWVTRAENGRDDPADLLTARHTAEPGATSTPEAVTGSAQTLLLMAAVQAESQTHLHNYRDHSSKRGGARSRSHRAYVARQ